jgi:hypothetical protein
MRRGIQRRTPQSNHPESNDSARISAAPRGGKVVTNLWARLSVTVFPRANFCAVNSRNL